MKDIKVNCTYAGRCPHKYKEIREPLNEAGYHGMYYSLSTSEWIYQCDQRPKDNPIKGIYFKEINLEHTYTF